jgi:16S rRNA (adenine1518-N6/adenine1519-N6)-dimethyltransferase
MKAKKSLGQNFLNSPSAVKAIIAAGEVEKNDVILEIGPGKGVLTKELLKTGATVVAIEKDDRLIIFLSQLFSKEIQDRRFILIHADVLDLVSMDGMSPNISKLLGKSYKLIANIPYYITGEIIKRFHTTPQTPSHMVLLVQKEVAERIIANDGKESMLSVSVKMYGIPKLVKIVPRGSFNPSPNVDSAILSIQSIHHFGNPQTEKDFFDILHAAFAHKRKLLVGNIKTLPVVLYDKVLRIIEENHLMNVRAEDVPIEVWKKMIQ